MNLMREIYWGDSLIRDSAEGGKGDVVHLDGEEFYKITNYHKMPPFFLSLVSGSDHWMFLSSTGGLTCGRRNPENALFPYCTDDKIHDAHSTTGPQTDLLVEQDGKTFLWQPFAQNWLFMPLSDICIRISRETGSFLKRSITILAWCSRTVGRAVSSLALCENRGSKIPACTGTARDPGRITQCASVWRYPGNADDHEYAAGRLQTG